MPVMPACAAVCVELDRELLVLFPLARRAARCGVCANRRARRADRRVLLGLEQVGHRRASIRPSDGTKGHAISERAGAPAAFPSPVVVRAHGRGLPVPRSLRLPHGDEPRHRRDDRGVRRRRRYRGDDRVLPAASSATPIRGSSSRCSPRTRCSSSPSEDEIEALWAFVPIKASGTCGSAATIG